MTNRTGIRLLKHAAALLIFLTLLSAIVGIAAPAGDATASEKRPTVAAGLISAARRILPPLARLGAGLQMVPRGSVLTGEGRPPPAADLGSWARSRG